MRKTLTLVAAAVLVATPTWAAEKTGFYVGGDVGQSNFNVSQAEADNFAAIIFNRIAEGSGAQLTSLSTNLHDHGTTWSLFVGYQFLPYLAVEAGYMDLGNTTLNAAGAYAYTDASTGSVSIKPKFESKGAALSVLGMYPFMDVWNVYARLGVFFADTKLSGNVNACDITVPPSPCASAGTSTSKNTSEFLWGVGASYTWDQRVSIRLEYDGIPNVGNTSNDTGTTNVGRITLGALYRF